MSFASLPMYDLPEVRAATDALWSGVARHLRGAGVPDVPGALLREGSPAAHWGDPSLLLSQSCGYPVTHAFAHALRVVATPRHAIAGCEAGLYFSVVVVREDAPFDALAALRGTVAAVNEPTSHSGTNALGALVAPLHPLTPLASGGTGGTGAEEEAFFREVVVTGSHEASLAKVVAGKAEVAAIDCVTHALLARWRPRALIGTRILTTTAPVPALPYVTRASASQDLVAHLRAALSQAMLDPELSAAREALLLGGITVLPAGAYDVIPRLQATHRLHLRAGR